MREYRILYINPSTSFLNGPAIKHYFVENVVFFEDIKVLVPWVFETLCKNFCTKVSIEVNDDKLMMIASLRDI